MLNVRPAVMLFISLESLTKSKVRLVASMLHLNRQQHQGDINAQGHIQHFLVGSLRPRHQ